MGIHDRDYNRAGTGFGGARSTNQGLFVHSPGWTVNTWIIVINIGIYILGVTIFRGPPNTDPLEHGLYSIGSLTIVDAFQRLEVWRLITFQFLHDPFSMWHLVMNMFGLWIFGPMVESYLKGKKYLAFYLVGGLCGGLLFSILTVLGNVTGANFPGLLSSSFQSPLIGASAGVFAVIVACAYIQPDEEVQIIFLPVQMKLKWFAYGYVGIALFQLLAGSHNAGGEAAHVGGAIAGFFFVRNSHLLKDFFDVFNDSRDPKTSKPKRPKQPRGVPSDEEVDRILAKVHEKGIGSLTEKEKKTLNKARKD